jgi:hypothetical protein
MEGHAWRIVCELLPASQTNDGRVKCDLRTVLMILLWSALNDRPRCWALRSETWRFRTRPEQFISEGQLSRRARQKIVQRALDRILVQLGTILDANISKPSSLAFADGSPVLVGGASTDPDAKSGRAVKGFGRGYKIHLVYGENGELHGHRITSLNANEGRQLKEMSAELPSHIKRIFADGSYDSGTVHRKLCDCSIRLVAPVKNGRVGRRQDPFRLASLKYLNSPRGKHHFKKRGAIERFFGALKSLTFGLQGLPSWVRRLHRVKRWITAKLIFFQANRLQRIAHKNAQ